MKDKKGSTFVIIMVIVSISIYIIVTVGIKVFEKVDFINYDKESKKELKDINKKYEDNEYAFNYDLTKNIEIKDYYIKDEGILIEITNKNDYPITSRIYTEFYDEKDELITVETNYIISISGAGKSYEKIYLNEELKKRYKSYKIKAIAEYDQYKLNLEDKIELISSKRDGSYYTIDFKNKFTVLELDELAGRKHLRQVILLQLIYQIQQAVYLGDRSKKKIVIIDEAWDLLKEGNVATFMEHAYRKFRKYGGAIVIATQSIDDLYTSQTGEAIAKNSASMFLLGQTEESVESVKKTGRLALNDYGYNMLKSVHTIPNVFSEIFLKTKTGIGVGRLIVSDFQKLLYSTAPEDVAAIQMYRDEGLSIIESIRKVLEDRRQSR